MSQAEFLESRREHLRMLLQRMEPFDATEAAYHPRMMELLDAPGDPFSRHHFDPGHFTASSFVLSPDRSAVLLIHHGKLHRWLQPGGHVDPGDSDVLAAARREVVEEASLDDLTLHVDGIFDIDIHEIPPLRDDPAHEHFDVRFLFVAQDTSYTAGSDAKDARWVPLSDVNEAESDRSVMRAIEKLLPTT